MLPEKKEKKFCLGSWIIKKISGTWEVPFALPFPRFPHSYCSVDGQSLNCIETTTSPPWKYLVWLDLFFFRHGDVDTSSFTYVASQLDCVLQTHAESSNDGTGEEDAQRVNQVYNTLCKQIRALELPLSVSSLQGISPVFRGAEVVDRGYCQPFLPILHKIRASVH